MSELPELLPHGDFESVFPDVFTLKGQMRLGPGGAIHFSRNMTVVREDGKLTLINVVRIDDEGLAALDALGTVTNFVKLGSYHGRDDAYYCQRYPEAKMWAPPGMEYGRGVVTHRELSSDSLPISDADLFVFETAGNIEAILRLSREGGILIPCDSLQNIEAPDEYFNDLALDKMAKFIGRALVGVGWLNAATPGKSDFDRLSALPFRHVLPSHGTPLLDEAHEAYSATFAELFS